MLTAKSNRIVNTFLIVNSLKEFGISWTFSIYVLYLLDQGMTLFQINLLNLGFMLGNVVFDPPTGYLADRIGKRWVFVSGQFFWGIAKVVYGLGNSFLWFLAAELTASVGSSLISGVLESWLRNNTDEQTTHKALSRLGVIIKFVSIPGVIGGSVVGQVFGLKWPWLIGGACAFVAVVVAIVLFINLPEGDQEEEAKTKPSLQEVVQVMTGVKAVRFTLIVAAVSTFAFQPFNMFWAPILKDVSGEVWWLGVFWVGIAMARALGSHLSGRLTQLNGRSISVALFAVGSPMLFTNFAAGAVLLVFLFLAHEIGRGAIPSLLFTYSNRHIPNRIRTTSNSVRSAASMIGAALGLGISGVLTFFFTPLAIWGGSAVLLIILSLWAWIRKE